MPSPLEQHLQKLSNSVKALLSVEIGEAPHKVTVPVVEAPTKKGELVSIWTTALIVFAGVILIGGGIRALSKK